ITCDINHLVSFPFRSTGDSVQRPPLNRYTLAHQSISAQRSATPHVRLSGFVQRLAMRRVSHEATRRKRNMMHRARPITLLSLLLPLLLVIAGCVAPAAPAGTGSSEPAATTAEASTDAPAETEGEQGGFTIGVSNTLVG